MSEYPRDFPENNDPNFEREGGEAALSLKIGMLLSLEVPYRITIVAGLRG
jgi:hypothetical protein